MGHTGVGHFTLVETKNTINFVKWTIEMELVMKQSGYNKSQKIVKQGGYNEKNFGCKTLAKNHINK